MKTFFFKLCPTFMKIGFVIIMKATQEDDGLKLFGQKILSKKFFPSGLRSFLFSQVPMPVSEQV